MIRSNRFDSFLLHLTRRDGFDQRDMSYSGIHPVWFKYTPGGLTLSSRNSSFIESVKQANHGNTA
jgi:hypothetical protein